MVSTIKNKNVNRSKNYFYFIIIVFALLLYAYFDIKNSKVVLNDNSDRSTAHLALVFLILLNLLFFAFNILRTGKIKFDSLEKTVLLMTVWITVNDILNSANLWTMMTHCGLSFLWFLTDYFFKEYFSNKKDLKIVYILFFIILAYYSVSTIYYLRLIFAEKDRFQVFNLAYNLLVLYPFFMLIKNEKLKMLFSVGIGTLVLVSQKRGAIIAFALMFIFYLVYSGINRKKTAEYFFKIIFYFALFVVGVFAINNVLNGALLDRFTKESLEDGSGRSWLYSYVFNLIIDRSPLTMLFGTGSGSSIWGTGAHNEWLEFAYSFGIVGLVIYFSLIFTMIKYVLKLRKTKSEWFVPCAMSLIYVIFVGMVGGIYFMQSSFFVFALFGLSKSGVKIKND